MTAAIPATKPLPMLPAAPSASNFLGRLDVAQQHLEAARNEVTEYSSAMPKPTGNGDDGFLPSAVESDFDSPTRRSAALDITLSDAFRSISELHAAVVEAPDARSAGWAARALDQAGQGTDELERVGQQLPTSFDLVNVKFANALSSISTARLMVTSPPSDDVYDGS